MVYYVNSSIIQVDDTKQTGAGGEAPVPTPVRSEMITPVVAVAEPKTAETQEPDPASRALVPVADDGASKALVAKVEAEPPAPPAQDEPEQPAEADVTRKAVVGKIATTYVGSYMFEQV